MSPAAQRRRRPWRALGILWLVALAVSHVVRSSREAPALPQGLSSIELTPLSGEEAAPAGTPPVRLAWAEDGSPEDRRPPVLMLHGSPGGRSDLRLVAERLGGRRCLRPDLPGFGASSRDLPDTSVRAHARYALEWLDALAIERVHVVGFSMGGGVALELSGLAPGHVASLTLLSAIGVQELELLGDHDLNRALHGLQLAAFWALTELVPHFGALDHAFLGIDYARNFFDTDQRPLRARLLAWDGPVRIVHGERDPLVPFAAALEHRRLVPQAELEVHPEGHFLVWQHPEEIAEGLEGFLARVEAGTAATRADVDPAALARAAQPFDPRSVPPLSGFSAALILVLLALSTLITEDLTCIAAGALVAGGRLGLVAASGACFVGILIGDVLLFLAGRWLGSRALARAPFTWFLDEADVRRAAHWLERRGPLVILGSRFLPGARLPTYFASGALGTGLVRFTLWFALAGLLWTPALVGISAWLGGELGRVEALKSRGGWALLATVAVVWSLAALVRAAATWRGRARWRARWRRTTRFEYWPMGVFYLPVFALVLWKALRGRALDFTAANPGLPLGGVVGESKRAIDAWLRAAGAPLPATLVLEAGLAPAEQRRRVRAFVESGKLTWPLVLKPDVGQRGDGVHVVADEAELLARLARSDERQLVQAYVAGKEFGLFYVRLPGQERGRLVSVAHKELPEVVGDGRRTIERLILEHPIHGAMARPLLASSAGRLDHVPASGERVSVGRLGTHCRGARFLQAAQLRTPELEAAVDALARRLEGFRLGRFDVRAASDEALRSGTFTILELNGVTSEPAHVYDPSFGVLAAWRDLLAQWRAAYAIGAEQRARGVPVASARDVWAAARAYRVLDRERRTRARAQDASDATPGTASAGAEAEPAL